MKNISITLEELQNGQIRITGRRDRRTVTFVDGSADQAKVMFEKVARETASDHMVNGVLSTDYVELNDAAKAIT